MERSLTVDYAEVERWVERARGKDPAAFRELYRLYLGPARRTARGFAELDEAELDDVVQESFASCFQSLGSLRVSKLFPAWLLSAVRNRALKAIDKKRNRAVAHEALLDVAPSVEQGIVSASDALERDAEIVRQLISELPDGPEKETVRLFYLEGELSAREIAERLGVGKSAVTMRLERFRGRIKRELLARVLKARVE